MQRFNLLLIDTSAETGRKALKSISRVFRRNFVFEVQDANEARELLTKLNIDMVLVDLDAQRVDLAHFSQEFPSTIVWGMSSAPHRVNVRIDPVRNRVFDKRDFASEMVAELKSIKKQLQKPAAPAHKRHERANSTDFRDFRPLVLSN